MYSQPDSTSASFDVSPKRRRKQSDHSFLKNMMPRYSALFTWLNRFSVAKRQKHISVLMHHVAVLVFGQTERLARLRGSCCVSLICVLANVGIIIIAYGN